MALNRVKLRCVVTFMKYLSSAVIRRTKERESKIVFIN